MKTKWLPIGALLCMAMATGAYATVITPNSDTFGSQPTYTFGGSGIPNDAVANTVVNHDGNVITLGLTAHGRYSNPTPANNGAGTFYAMAGGDGAHGQPGYGLWNFGFYVNMDPNRPFYNPADYMILLRFDLSPVVANDVTSFAVIEPNPFNGPDFDSQDSWNLGMQSLFGPGFDPNALGEYSIQLEAYYKQTLIGSAGINIVVNDTGTIPTPVPDNGTTVALLGAGMVGMGVLKRKLS